MILTIDLGGTNIRYNFGGEKYIKQPHNFKSLTELKGHVFHIVAGYPYRKYDVEKIVFGFPGIVENYCVKKAHNLPFLEGVQLWEAINNIPIEYINDVDLALLSEIEYNGLNKEENKSKNIMYLLFGTGVGVSLCMQGKLVRNCEIGKMLGKFMSGKDINRNDMINIFSLFTKIMSSVIELLNVDVLIVNGFIKNYPGFNNLTVHDFRINKYNKEKLQLIVSDIDEPVLYGGELFHLFH